MQGNLAPTPRGGATTSSSTASACPCMLFCVVLPHIIEVPASAASVWLPAHQQTTRPTLYATGTHPTTDRSAGGKMHQSRMVISGSFMSQVKTWVPQHRCADHNTVWTQLQVEPYLASPVPSSWKPPKRISLVLKTNILWPERAMGPPLDERCSHLKLSRSSLHRSR